MARLCSNLILRVIVWAPSRRGAFALACAMGRSWVALQNPHDVLGSGDRRDGERERKNQLFEGGHAENGSTAGRSYR